MIENLTGEIEAIARRFWLRAADERAWSQCGEVPVTGVAYAQGFAPVAAFAA
jgi:hypothetical protein